MILNSHSITIPRQPTLDNSFIGLPNEIVHDVVGSTPNLAAVRTLSEIKGSWAEFGELAKANWKLRHTNVVKCLGVEELRANAAKYCENIHFYYFSENYCEILELFGTRFSRIVWKQFKPSAQSDLALLQIKAFFKRQLKSNYLRSLWIADIQTEDELFVDFVQRPQFEKLEIEASTLPLQVFEEAHRCWEMTTRFEVQNKAIGGTITQESFEQLEKYFKTNLPLDYTDFSLQHPVYDCAEMRLKGLGDYGLHVQFFCSYS